MEVIRKVQRTSLRIRAGHCDIATQTLGTHPPTEGDSSANQPWKADKTKLVLSVTDPTVQ